MVSDLDKIPQYYFTTCSITFLQSFHNTAQHRNAAGNQQTKTGSVYNAILMTAQRAASTHKQLVFK